MKQWILCGVVLFAATVNAALPVGTLVHDGPPTPEQLSLLLPVTGALSNAATATVRYKQSSSATWIEGHPLFRIRPDHTSTSGAVNTISVTDDFAWPIIDLLAGVTYDVEVTVSDGVETQVRTGVFTTRALPGPAGTVTTTIAAGSSQGQIQSILNNAAPGDVIEFQNGVYDLGGEDIAISGLVGTAAQPIYVRGASRDGVVLRNGTPRTFYFIGDVNHVIIENMTLQGRGRDNGVRPTAALQVFEDADGSSHLTLRNLTLDGHDQVIRGMRGTESFLVYDNTFVGNNAWEQDLYARGGFGPPGTGDGIRDIDQNIFWNDDGINMPGVGHAVFNNTLRGFGDSLSFCSHSGSNATAECRGIHFYRNDIVDSGDDCAEMDYAFRNVSMYDNRCINGMTAVSLDNGYGGPFLAARNIFVNIGRSAYKFNGTVSGHFVYNNTLIITANVEDFGWIQFNNGANRSWGYRNNLFIYQNAQDLTYFNEAPVHNPIDFTHNSWFPDSRFVWNNSGGSGNSLAQAFANLPATTPVFSGQTQRHFEDTIVSGQPFISPVTLPFSYETRFDDVVTPQIAPASNASASGVIIPNITDGHGGALPDRGAVVAGRPAVTYGDRSVSAGLPPTVDLNATPTTVDSGTTTLLTWTSTNATGCTASGGWSGSRATTNSAGETSAALIEDTQFVLTCSGAGGSRSDSVTVDVTDSVAVPTVALSAMPNPVASGGDVTLTWSSENTSSCEASGDWSGAKDLAGSETISGLMQSQSYLLTCTGPGGGSSDVVNVVVTNVGVTVSLMATPASVTAGGSVTLAWSSTGATSCSASGDWSGAKDVSGSQTIDALTQDQRYVLSCTGGGGDATDMADVTVTSAPVSPGGDGGGGGSVSIWVVLGLVSGWSVTGIRRRRYNQPL